MSSLKTFFESDFNTLREQWEKALLAELKLPEVGNKATRKMLNGMSWPTLSLDAKSEIQLTPEEPWKKASVTYAFLDHEEIAAEIGEDLKTGARNFFFHPEALNENKWNSVRSVLEKFPRSSEIEVFMLGKNKFESASLKVIHELVSGKEAHDQGGHSIQELAFLAKNLVQNIDQSGDIYLGVYVDSQFFHNIAKLRASRLLAMKILQEAKKENKVKVVALTSYQGWSLFERYSNMLRNETAVASAYIGGADHVQSSGYNTLLELEAETAPEKEHVERSRRMARNTTHVLGLESMLGVVEDAAFGSFHLENLTESLCEEAWKLMQRLLSGEDISSEIAHVREQRLQMMKTRKTIMSGINDYPDVKEQLKVKLKGPAFFRSARIFEELRLKMEGSKKPEVYIALFGEYGALNARLNFVKNYFELLGLQVHEPGHSVLDIESFKKNLMGRKEDIVVLCALDDQYPALAEAASTTKASFKYIAGKFEMSSYENLYAGQNVYEVLEDLVRAFEGRKV